MNEPNQRFEVSLRNVLGGISLDLKGEISKGAEQTLFQAVEFNEEIPAFIIFNFSSVTYINSSGISTIIRIIRRCMEGNVVMLGHGISSLQEKLFKAVGITDYILFYPDEYAVLQRLKQVDLS